MRLTSGFAALDKFTGREVTLALSGVLKLERMLLLHKLRKRET